MVNKRKPNLKAFLVDNLKGPMPFKKNSSSFSRIMRRRSLLARAVVAISAGRDVDRGKNHLPVGEREVLIHLEELKEQGNTVNRRQTKRRFVR